MMTLRQMPVSEPAMAHWVIVALDASSLIANIRLNWFSVPNVTML